MNSCKNISMHTVQQSEVFIMTDSTVFYFPLPCVYSQTALNHNNSTLHVIVTVDRIY